MSVSNITGYTCPLPDPQFPTRLEFTLFITVFYPVFLFLGIGLFLYYRKSSVLLRKRPVIFIYIGLIGYLIGWVAWPLHDYLGPNAPMPCWFTYFCFYLSPAFVKSPLVLKDAKYLSDVAAIRMGKEMASKRVMALRQSSRSHLHLENEIDIIEANASWANFLAHLRIASRTSRTPEDKYKHIQFTRSYAFIILWCSCIIIPCLIAYFVRLGTVERAYQGCSGCNFEYVDGIIMLAILLSGTTVGNALHLKKVSSRDTLLITRETQLCWRAGWVCWIAMALYLGDVGGGTTSGEFNWQILVLVPPAFIFYFQTFHQVIVSRRLMSRMLTESAIDRAERFADVQSNKELRNAFRSHLDSELSSEIYLFMESVDKYKSHYDKYKDGRFMKAKAIIETFIDPRKATFEVNISSRVRESLTTKYASYADGDNSSLPSETENDIPQDIFDQAYQEVKESMLVDGFVRFLAKLGPGGLLSKNASSRSHLSMAITSTPLNKTRSAHSNVSNMRSSDGGDSNDEFSPQSSPVASTQRYVPAASAMTVKFSFSEEDVGGPQPSKSLKAAAGQQQGKDVAGSPSSAASSSPTATTAGADVDYSKDNARILPLS